MLTRLCLMLLCVIIQGTTHLSASGINAISIQNLSKRTIQLEVYRVRDALSLLKEELFNCLLSSHTICLNEAQVALWSRKNIIYCEFVYTLEREDTDPWEIEPLELEENQFAFIALQFIEETDRYCMGYAALCNGEISIDFENGLTMYYEDRNYIITRGTPRTPRPSPRRHEKDDFSDEEQLSPQAPQRFPRRSESGKELATKAMYSLNKQSQSDTSLLQSSSDSDEVEGSPPPVKKRDRLKRSFSVVSDD